MRGIKGFAKIEKDMIIGDNVDYYKVFIENFISVFKANHTGLTEFSYKGFCSAVDISKVIFNKKIMSVIKEMIESGKLNAFSDRGGNHKLNSEQSYDMVKSNDVIYLELISETPTYFVKMDNDVFINIFCSNMNYREVLTKYAIYLHIVIDFSNSSSGDWYSKKSINTLSKKLDMSRTTVSKYLKALNFDGAIYTRYVEIDSIEGGENYFTRIIHARPCDKSKLDSMNDDELKGLFLEQYY